jgi:hypothetical protein
MPPWPSTDAQNQVISNDHGDRDQRSQWNQAEAFWASVLDQGGIEKMNDFDFASGFIDKALELWDTIRDRMD